MSNGFVEFEATEEQIKQIALNAINKSRPAGLGFLHFEDKDYTIREIENELNPDPDFKVVVDLDYFHGRMVKLVIFGNGEGKYKINKTFNAEYQSFADFYPTPESLLESAGVETWT